VGAYAIIRVYTLIFPPDLEVTAGLHDVWLMPAALISLALGMIGVLAAKSLDRLVAFAVIGSMGMVMVAIALMTPEGIAAALYYIVHSTLAGAALFLIADLVKSSRPSLALHAQPPIAGAPITAALFFAAAIAMAGLPPLSGFIGKLLILDASFETQFGVWIWAIVLSASLISVVGFARAGSVVFWIANSVEQQENMELQTAPHFLSYTAAGGLVALMAAFTVFGGYGQAYMTKTSEQLFSPEPYIAMVMETEGKLSGASGEGDH
jgi:multicomponent K+:H+ antiporter subunit D